MAETNVNFSGRMLLRLVLLGAMVLVLLVANVKFIDELYFTRQLTKAGFVINGAIVAVFLLGLVKIILSLVRYMREEEALARLVSRLLSGHENPLKGIGSRSIIARRYTLLHGLSEKYARINHSALAATLLASESTRISFARYVSNILILTGVFGTIVSLSIALAGASNLLDDISGSGNMGMVIHGMSTALSTTITAILCYLFYGYFYLKLGDAQSNVLSKVEEVTSVYLLPRFSRDCDSLMHEVSGLVGGLHDAATGLKDIQQDFSVAGDNLRGVVTELASRVSQTSEDINEVKQLLRDGFRLPPDES
jgi:biopolymer transport protein ExbB/TolQ